MHGDSFDEEHIDPHGECAAEIRHLQAERDSLAAQLAVACEALKRAAETQHTASYIQEYIVKPTLSKLGGGVMTTSLPRAVEAR